MHSGGIWNDMELQKKWEQGRYMVHSEGIWNDLELHKKWKQGR